MTLLTHGEHHGGERSRRPRRWTTGGTTGCHDGKDQHVEPDAVPGAPALEGPRRPGRPRRGHEEGGEGARPSAARPGRGDPDRRRARRGRRGDGRLPQPAAAPVAGRGEDLRLPGRRARPDAGDVHREPARRRPAQPGVAELRDLRRARRQRERRAQHGARRRLDHLPAGPAVRPGGRAEVRRPGRDVHRPVALRGLPAPVVLSAWNHQLQLQSADDPRIDAFLAKYVQGAQTPEPGALCSNGTGTPTG